MKNNKLVVLLLLMMFLVSCGDNTQDKHSISDYVASEVSETSTVSPHDATAKENQNAEEIYNGIMGAEYLDVVSAYEQLQNVTSNDEKVNDLIENLSNLTQCQGRFVQDESESDQPYTADVSFYLSKGSIYANVVYTNYMGDLEDGLVKRNVQNGYLYESDTTGQFYSSTHDFKMYFGPEEFYISWGNACTYALTRGDGSVQNVTAAERPFEESSLYELLDETIAKAFNDFNYNIRYNEDEDCVEIEIEAPGENGALRDLLAAGEEQRVESWNNLVSSIDEFGASVHEIITVGTGPRHSKIYIVDQLHDDGMYSKNEYLLLIQDGTEEYKYEPPTHSTTVSGAFNTDKNQSAVQPSAPSVPSTSIATTGERNALSKAKDYLDFTSFSYSGLIEQLEFEGFTHSEAVYGADNCGADWKEQAVLKAADYLDFTSFSRQGLIEQLEYEGFTHEQAVYGAEQNGY